MSNELNIIKIFFFQIIKRVRELNGGYLDDWIILLQNT